MRGFTILSLLLLLALPLVALAQGPAALAVEETGLYTATYAPLTATLPVTFTWAGGAVGATAAYSWTLPGVYTLTVTATNPCGGPAVADFVVVVWSYRFYLPLVVRG